MVGAQLRFACYCWYYKITKCRCRFGML